MKGSIIGGLAGIVAALILFTVATASAEAAGQGRWIRGTNYMVSEEDANNFLEKAIDHVYCQGVPRYGTQGEFPYQEYVMFDCSLDDGDLFCSDVRFKAIKGSARGKYKMKLVRGLDESHCY